MTYYVDCKVEATGNGSKESPFKTIQEAADIAVAGDEVIVAEGVYREYVDPKNAGAEDSRIVYRSEKPLGAVITGAEPMNDWEEVEPHVWKTKVDNSFFGDYNPFNTLVSGDWFVAFITAHTGDVFLNEKSMYEVLSLDEVRDPKVNYRSWDKDFTVYVWYTEQEGDSTVIYANFQDIDPRLVLTGQRAGSSRTAMSMSRSAVVYLWASICSQTMIISG